jgi:ribosomal protein S18 acetylase RimI-like enzyme
MEKLFNFSDFVFESKDSFSVRLAVNDDYREIKRIANQHREYLPFVMRVAIEESIKRNEVLVAISDGYVIGFCHFHKRKDGITTIHEIAVDKDYSRQGVASKLISLLETPLQLKVTVDNPANEFYRKIGFTLKGISKGKHKDLNVYYLD